jgi:hypothetical protein
MQKTIDVSELTDVMKAKLLQKYLEDMAAMYERRAKAAHEDPEGRMLGTDILFDDKAQEVVRLMSWASIIIDNHIGRRQADALTQSMTQQQIAMNQQRELPLDTVERHVKSALAELNSLVDKAECLVPHAGPTTRMGGVRVVLASVKTMLEGVQKVMAQR